MATPSKDTKTSEIMGIGEVAVTDIPKMLDLAVMIEPKLAMCFVGDTGIGKTPLVHAWAKARGAACHVLNFGHMQPQDISMALFAEDGSDYGYVPPRWMRKMNEDAADKEKYPGGAVFFIDELNRAPIELLNAMFTLTDDRRVHDFMLHENVLVVGAMNPASDGHNVTKFERDPAMRKRLSFVHVTEDLAGWLKHARASGFPDVIIDYLSVHGGSAFYDRLLRAAGKTFATPAAWDKAARILMADAKLSGGKPGFSASAKTALRGTIGFDAANMLVAFDIDRAFTPVKVFEATVSLAYDKIIDLIAKVPNDPRATAFRRSTAEWVRDMAFGTPAEPVNATSRAGKRFKGYVSALASEHVAAFLGEVGAAVTSMPPGDQAKAWQDISALYAACDLEEILRRQAQSLSAD